VKYSNQRIDKRKIKQSGVTLLELMLALALGIIVVAVLLKMFDASHINYRNISALNELEENVALSNDMMTKELQKAGYRPFSSVIASSTWQRAVKDLTGLDGLAAEVSKELADKGMPGVIHPVYYLSHQGASMDDLRNLHINGGVDSDIVRVYFFGDEEHLMRGCAGTRIPYYSIGYSQFYVQNNNLFCSDGYYWTSFDRSQSEHIAGNPMVLLRGTVDQMFIRYLVSVNHGYPTASNCNTQQGRYRAYMTAQNLENYCTGQNLINTLRNILVELDLNSSKHNIVSRNRLGLNYDASGAASDNGHLMKQTIFTVAMRNRMD